MKDSSNEAGYLPIPRRALAGWERECVAQILAANQKWADVEVSELFAIASCPCGCRSIQLERPSMPQNRNPAWLESSQISCLSDAVHLRYGVLIGSIDIVTKNTGLITVQLHGYGGYLDYLEVIWYNPGPMPETWEEVSREVRSR